MKVAAQIVFLLFYIAAAYTAGETRLGQTILEIRHAISSENDSAELRSVYRDSTHGLPKYRQAKKVEKDFVNRPPVRVEFSAKFASREYTIPELLLTIQFQPDTSHSRAPPILT